MGSLSSHFSIARYECPVPPPFTTAPSIHCQMPCLNLEDCDDPIDEDGEDVVDDDEAQHVFYFIIYISTLSDPQLVTIYFSLSFSILDLASLFF